MASRFWVGGTNTWDNSNTASWSTTSGGGGGASIPGTGDAVFFDSSSGGGVVTVMAVGGVCSTFNSSGFTGTFTGGLPIKPNGNVNLGANFGTGITFNATGTLTTNGFTILNLTTSSGTTTLGDNLIVTTGTININSPLTTSNFSITTNGAINVQTTGTFNMGSSLITMASQNNFSVIGSGIVNAGTSTIKFTNTGNTSFTFNGNGKTFNNVWFSRGTSTGTITISGSNTFSNFKDDGTGTHSILFTVGTTQTVSTFTVSGTSGHLISLDSTTTGIYTLTSASGIINCDYLNIQHCIATGGASWYAGANSTNNQAVATAGSGWIFTAVPLTLNIVSYWKLDGNSNDSAGSNNGTDTSIAYSSGNGIIIQGAGFNGSTGKIVMGAPVIPIGSKSVTFWIKTSTTSDQTAICNFRLGTSDNGDYLHLTTGGFFEYAIQYAGGSSTMATGTINIHDGNWHFCAGTYDGSVIKVYVGGTLQNTSGSFVDSGARTNNLQFGFDPVNGFNKLTGDLDEIGVWNRTLSQSEITQLYNGGIGLQYPFASNNASSGFLSFM